MSSVATSTDLNDFAVRLRQELENKKFILLFAYNGTGKTRLSTIFNDLGKTVNAEEKPSSAIRSTSTPSPKTCSRGTTTWSVTASGS